MLLEKLKVNNMKCVRKLSNSRSIAVVEHNGKEFLFLYGRKRGKESGGRLRRIIAFIPSAPTAAAHGSAAEGGDAGQGRPGANPEANPRTIL